jgi:hypothetical protein
MTTRVGIYARVSTVNHGQDVSKQTRELRQFAEALGWSVTGEYIEAGVSGAKDSRPELNRLMADVHKRKFDVVSGGSIGSRVPSRTYCGRWRRSRFWESTSCRTRSRWTPARRPGR